MPSFAALGNLPGNSVLFSSSSPSISSRRRPSATPAPRHSSVKCDLPTPSSSSVPSPSINPKPSKKNRDFSLLKSLSKPLAVAGVSAASLLIHLTPVTNGPNNFNGGNGDWFGGGGWGGGGGGDGSAGGGGGDFWRRFFTPATANADEEQNPEWDTHGLPANIIVQLNKLSGFKKYKVSEIFFLDKRRGSKVGIEDPFFEMVSLRPGGIYNKAQLQKELESLATCGMFEKVDLDGKTNPDGTLGITISFTESTWQSADKFRCINVGLMPQSKPIEMDPDMTDKEKMDYYRSQEKDYRRRIEKARPCLLPAEVHREVQVMLKEHGKVSARLLQKIRDRVQKWYHDEGYACAQVVNFGNLNTREVVCEVVEGDVTQLVIQYLDKLGNVVEGQTQVPVVKRELPRQVS